MVVEISGIRCIHVVSLSIHSVSFLFSTSTCSISHLAALSSGDCRENAFDPSTNPGITQREPVRASPIVTSYYEYMSIRVLLTSTCTCIRLDGTVKYEQGKPLIHAQTIPFYILSIVIVPTKMTETDNLLALSHLFLISRPDRKNQPSKPSND